MVNPSASVDLPGPTRPAWTGGQVFAAISAGIACVVLLGVIKYCPTYSADKSSLFRLFTDTFWWDLTSQIKGLFSGVSKESLSGEATASEWTYCGMVPLIVAGLVWYLRPKLRQTEVRGESAGYGILVGGFLIYTFGFLMENYYVGMASMEFVYAGLIVLFFGWGVMRVLVFPWAFLMFMWPYNFLEDVALQLRLVMSEMSHLVLQFLGVANILDGTAVISAPFAPHNFAIDIADPCSGIRSLFALLMLGSIYAFLAFHKVWQQALITALTVPLVLVGNLVRILLLVWGTIHFGDRFALGTNEQPSWFHEGAGYLVYLVNFGGLILIGNFLARLTSRPPGHAHT